MRAGVFHGTRGVASITVPAHACMGSFVGGAPRAVPIHRQPATAPHTP
jgi:hypothetical protein